MVVGQREDVPSLFAKELRDEVCKGNFFISGMNLFLNHETIVEVKMSSCVPVRVRRRESKSEKAMILHLGWKNKKCSDNARLERTRNKVAETKRMY